MKADTTPESFEFRECSAKPATHRFVHRSRTITQTILAHWVLSPFCLGLLFEVSTSRPGGLSGFRRGRCGPREGRKAKVFSAVRAKHDSVGHLLESRCAATTTEVFEALRERASGSVEDADVVERGGLADFAAPLDSFLSVAAHDKLGESHSLLYSQVGRFGGKSTGVLPGLARPGIGPGPGLRHDARSHSTFPSGPRRTEHRNKSELVANSVRVAGDCPR